MTAVGLEPLAYKPAAVVSVLVKLPTGGEELPGYGCSGLAFGSTLISAGGCLVITSTVITLYLQ